MDGDPGDESVTRILAVGGDPGGARALAPVLEALLRRGAAIRVLGYRQAVDIWIGQGIDVERLPESKPVDPAAWIGDTCIALVVTSTSVNGVDHERAFVHWAEVGAVPSLSVLDFWSNYSARFRNSDGSGLSLPSFVAVMDDRARREMAAEGFPSDRLVVTGQPAFDAIGAFRAGWTEAKRDGARRLLAVEGKCRVVLFASQPLAEMARLTGSPRSGFDERGVLLALTAALDEIAKSERMEITLVVRPHPRERLEYAALPHGERVKTILSAAGDAWTAALAADVVVGMTTALLVEACLLGCAVVSVQPGGESTDPVPTNRSRYSIPVYDLYRLPTILRTCLLDDDLRATRRGLGISMGGNATTNVIELIDRMMKPREQNA